ncbi:MAG: hypothetical protein QM759_00395 [Terricaulis sp.]
MTIIFRRSDELELNLCEFSGSIGMGELKALAKYEADKPDILGSDTLNLVRADADFSALSFEMLNAIFEHYRQLFTPLRLEIFRRAVWYCESDAPKPHIAHWLSLDAKEGMSSTVKQCHSFAEAADWLLLMDTESALLETGEGFRELACFQIPPEPARGF